MLPRLTPLRAVALLVAAVTCLGVVVLRPLHQVVERVAFEGHHHATEAQLRHLADLRSGTVMWGPFGVDPALVAARVARHPWIASATVLRELPGTVRVRVTEREPVALLAWPGEGGGLFYVDARGVPFLRAGADALDLPVISGLEADLASREPSLGWLVLRDAVHLLRALSGSVLPADRISEVRFHPVRGFTVTTTSTSLLAVAGQGSGRAGAPASAGEAPEPVSVAGARVLFAPGEYARQIRHLEQLVDSGVDLTQPLHIDVAPATVAIVRPQDASVAALLGRTP